MLAFCFPLFTNGLRRILKGINFRRRRYFSLNELSFAMFCFSLLAPLCGLKHVKATNYDSCVQTFSLLNKKKIISYVNYSKAGVEKSLVKNANKAVNVSFSFRFI